MKQQTTKRRAAARPSSIPARNRAIRWAVADEANELAVYLAFKNGAPDRAVRLGYTLGLSADEIQFAFNLSVLPDSEPNDRISLAVEVGVC